MISIIIPTLNEKKIIEHTLKNLQKGLTNVPHELIVSDGGSSDDTVEIARLYAVVLSPFEGAEDNVARGKNRGARAAHGEYLLFLDADVTILHSDKFFEKALSYFEKDRGLVGLTGPIQVLNEYATKTDKFVFWILNTFRYLISKATGGNRVVGGFQMVKTGVFKQLGGYCETIVASEDLELFARLSRIGKTRFLPDLVIFDTGRRAHTIGWLKLLSIWSVNILSVMLLQCSISKKWEEVR